MHLTQMSPTFEAALGNLGDLIFQGDQCVFRVCVCVCVCARACLSFAFQNKTFSGLLCSALGGEVFEFKQEPGPPPLSHLRLSLAVFLPFLSLPHLQGSLGHCAPRTFAFLCHEVWLP